MGRAGRRRRSVSAGALLAWAGLAAGCVDQGTKLGALPPVNLELYLGTTGGDGISATSTGLGEAMLNLVATDPARCLTLSYDTVAKVNGAPLTLDENGYTSSTQSGAPYCVVDQYDGNGILVGGDATLTLEDDTGTFTVVAAGGLEPGTVAIVSPADGIMHLGATEVQLAIPARGRTVSYANIWFQAAGASDPSFNAELGSFRGPTISGETLSFSVPPLLGIDGSGATGAGTLFASLQFADEVTACDGPVACTVFTGMVVTVPATLSN
jgi:hypothetical protein